MAAYVVFALHALHIYVEVQLAHAADNGLPALRVIADSEGGVLPLKPTTCVTTHSRTGSGYSNADVKRQARECRKRGVYNHLQRHVNEYSASRAFLQPCK